MKHLRKSCEIIQHWGSVSFFTLDNLPDDITRLHLHKSSVIFSPVREILLLKKLELTKMMSLLCLFRNSSMNVLAILQLSFWIVSSSVILELLIQGDNKIKCTTLSFCLSAIHFWTYTCLKKVKWQHNIQEKMLVTQTARKITCCTCLKQEDIYYYER